MTQFTSKPSNFPNFSEEKSDFICAFFTYDTLQYVTHLQFTHI